VVIQGKIAPRQGDHPGRGAEANSQGANFNPNRTRSEGDGQVAEAAIVATDPAQAVVTDILARTHAVKANDGVARYLRGRGITIPIPNNVRVRRVKRHAACEMIVTAQSYDSPFNVVALQRTRLEAVGNAVDGTTGFVASRKDGKKMCNSHGPISRAIALFPGSDEGPVVITEGVEDALSILQETKRTVGVVFGVRFIGNVSTATVPDGEVVIAADNDAPDSAAAAELNRAIGVLQRNGLRVLLARPPEDVHDFNDLLRQQGGNAVRAAIDAAVEAPEMRPTAPTNATLLAEMNESFFVTTLKGKTQVATLGEDPEFPGQQVITSFSTFEDFTNLHGNRRVEAFDADGKPVQVGLGRWWLR